MLYKEEVMREGMQIESADISLEDRVRLLNSLGSTGLKHIVVGSFVRADYTPQMAAMEELLRRFEPQPGVTYTALTLNKRGLERAQEFSPPLTLAADPPRLAAHMCDVFARRNINRSAQQVRSGWESIVEKARTGGAQEGAIGAHSAWGSNFTGPQTVANVMRQLAAAYESWETAGIDVTQAYLGDPMSWTTPHQTEALLTAIKQRWPHIRRFTLHLHDARAMALPSAYAALRVLDPADTVQLEGTVGGIGGCPYCGNGRATGMMATEDLLHMLESMGIDHGVDLDKIIGCAWMLDDILGRSTPGRVSKAGPRPVARSDWYDPNLPLIETYEQARHFRDGAQAYAGARTPWGKPIPGPTSVI